MSILLSLARRLSRARVSRSRLAGEFGSLLIRLTSGGKIYVISDSSRSRFNEKALDWRTFSTLAILFLLMDGIMKLFNPAPVVEGMIRLGYPLSLTATIGSFCSRLLWFMRFHIRQF